MAFEFAKEGAQAGNVVAICIPTKNGMNSTMFSMSLVSLQSSINTSFAWFSVIGKPVDEARNYLVEQAKAANAKYIFFIDDDTTVPPFAISRLMNLKTKVASGVYYTKTQPPVPVMLKKDVPGGFDNWQYGDVVEVDYIGLGCALIDISVFDEIEKPYFKFIKSDGTVQNSFSIGEDVYFCEKVKNAGHKIYVDTAVTCGHEDFINKTTYFYYAPTKTGAWVGPDGKICYIPPVKHSAREDITKLAVGGVKLCFGYGNNYPDGFESVKDINVDTLRERYINVEEVKIKNTFEYMTTEDSEAMLVSIYKIMKEGAKIEVSVPNIVSFINKIEDKSGVDVINAIFGYPGAKYRSAYTKKHIEELAGVAGFKEVSVGEDGDSIVFEGTK